MLKATVSTLIPRMRLKLFKPNIENAVFKLHYQLTVTLLIAFVILVCATEYFGDHIKCISDQGVPDHVIETYCFFMATFTIVRHYDESLLQSGVLPHPGVGPMMDSDETLHHTYYQWVPFVLFIQSICFYMPHYIWKRKEGGRIKALVDGLQYAALALEDQDLNFGRGTIPSKQTLDERIELIKKDIILRLRLSRAWSTWMVAMEVTNLLHVMFQIWIINRFLNGHFISLGGQVLNYGDWSQIADPLEIVFPKVTKCLFHKYGPSGSIQQHDALCVMALNIVHEKIYTVLWFWLLFLFIASALAVLWRLTSFILYRRSLRFNQLVFSRANSGNFNPYTIIQLINGYEFGDWLFLYYLAKNMSGLVFTALFTKLFEDLKKQELAEYVQDNKENQAESDPVLVSLINYDDETRPMRDDKKVS